jgi:hypothetical protein
VPAYALKTLTLGLECAGRNTSIVGLFTHTHADAKGYSGDPEAGVHRPLPRDELELVGAQDVRDQRFELELGEVDADADA